MSEDQATFETREDAGKGGPGAYRLWTAALEVAEKDEKEYRKQALAAVQKYRAEEKTKASKFNILYSSIQTQEPAVYNSTPVPDVRRRNGDADETGKLAAQVFERVLTHNMDEGDFDYPMEAVVHDSLLAGRGIGYVVYEPITDENGEVVDEIVRLEHAQWDDFRRGPGKRWTDVPWVAVRFRITRDEAIKLSPENGRTVNLDHVDAEMAKEKDAKDIPDVFKRLTVWKIWDKSRREIVFLAPSFKEGLFAVQPDELQLKGFFPFPRPIYDVSSTSSLVPVVPFEMYRNQAEELDTLTRRIQALVKVLRWRGIRPSQIEELDRLADAEDGELIPSESASSVMAAAQAGGLDKLIWMMPIDRLITVIRELVVQREQVKQVVFEISGLADIMRGETNPNETLGAQQIKAQWGSMRMQRRQREVQRFARDAIRLMAEIVGEQYSTETIAMASGMNLPTAEQKMMAQQASEQQRQQATPEIIEFLSQPTWDEVRRIMSSDSMRSYVIDIETDSTITADQTRAQQNMAAFVQGFASFTAAVGPGVESGQIPMDVATDLLTGFARNFKLGKQAEDALERLGKTAKKAEDPQMAQKHAQMQAALQEAQQRAQQAEQALQQLQGDQQAKQAEIVTKQQDSARKAEMDSMELQRKAQADEVSAAMEARKLDLAERAQALDELRYEDERMRSEMEYQTAAGTAENEAQAVSQITASLQAATEVAAASAEAAQITGASLTEAAQSLAAAAEKIASASTAPRTARIVRGPNGEKMAISEAANA